MLTSHFKSREVSATCWNNNTKSAYFSTFVSPGLPVDLKRTNPLGMNFMTRMINKPDDMAWYPGRYTFEMVKTPVRKNAPITGPMIVPIPPRTVMRIDRESN